MLDVFEIQFQVDGVCLRLVEGGHVIAKHWHDIQARVWRGSGLLVLLVAMRGLSSILAIFRYVVEPARKVGLRFIIFFSNSDQIVVLVRP